jgi:hypothetical protein
MNKAPDTLQVARLKRLATLPDDQIDTSDMPVIADWSHGIRGGTPSEVRRKVAAMAQGHTAQPKAGITGEAAAAWQVDHVSGTQRSWYRYDFKVGNTVRHSGITQDLERREIEHRQLWPTGRIVVVSAPISARAARQWDSLHERRTPALRAYRK